MIKKGILKAFDSGTYTATVQVQGSLSVWLEDVPVSRGIPTATCRRHHNCRFRSICNMGVMSV